MLPGRMNRWKQITIAKIERTERMKGHLQGGQKKNLVIFFTKTKGLLKERQTTFFLYYAIQLIVIQKRPEEVW